MRLRCDPASTTSLLYKPLLCKSNIYNNPMFRTPQLTTPKYTTPKYTTPRFITTLIYNFFCTTPFLQPLVYNYPTIQLPLLQLPFCTTSPPPSQPPFCTPTLVQPISLQKYRRPPPTWIVGVPSSQAWDELPDHSRGAAHPLRSTGKRFHQG